MAASGHLDDLTAWPTQTLLATLRTLGVGRETYAQTLIEELSGRGDSLNQISTKTGVPASTVKRWARRAKADTCTPQDTATT